MSGVGVGCTYYFTIVRDSGGHVDSARRIREGWEAVDQGEHSSNSESFAANKRVAQVQIVTQ